MDKIYWNSFYKKKTSLSVSSDFCNFIMKYFENNKNIKHILDAGCGNGRDSIGLSKTYKVTGVDNCGFILDDTSNFKFINNNFITINKDNYDLIYSRFTFHSITNEDHLKFLSSIKPNTYLSIEARSAKDCDKPEYYGKTHYRNYIDLEYIKDILTQHNFEILFIKEGNNMAIYKTENPICIRVVCKKSAV